MIENQKNHKSEIINRKSFACPHKKCYFCLIMETTMKRLITIFFAVFVATMASAQTENEVTTLSDLETQRYKNFDGFLLDMGSMLDMPAYLAPPTLTYRPFDTMLPSTELTIRPEAMRINPKIIFKGGVPGVSLLQSFYSLYCPTCGNANWQGASFKLNNGMRINTYGEYNADGYKVYNPAAMPWEKNNFNAAFEIKSANGNFGIKVEMHGGRNNPY